MEKWQVGEYVKNKKEGKRLRLVRMESMFMRKSS